MRMPLKALEDIFQPDPRSAAFVKLDAAGECSNTIDGHRMNVAAIEMSDQVPESIRQEFDTVRNLYLYSWYVYEFTVPAILYAHALIEKAIKERCSRSPMPLENIKGLKKLLKLCIAEGWLTNADFEHALEMTRMEVVAEDPELSTVHSIPRFLPADTDFCEHLAETLPEIRNMGAHGEAGLGSPAGALHDIEICVCIANALFRDSRDAAAAERDRRPPRAAPRN